MVEAEGLIETSAARPSGRGVVVDQKVSSMMRELKKYEMSVTGISETIRFRQAVYKVESYSISTLAGLSPRSPLLRNEGVGIVLNSAMAAAWREAGEEWKAVNPKVIKARVKMGTKQLDGVKVPTHSTVVGVYICAYL